MSTASENAGCMAGQAGAGGNTGGRRALGPLESAILGVLAVEPRHIRQICALVSRDYDVVGQTMKRLRTLKAVIIVGFAGQQGYTDIRRDALLYALPGTPLLAVPESVTKSRSGTRSGVIAGPIVHGRRMMQRW